MNAPARSARPLIVLKYGGHAIAMGAQDAVLDECADRWHAGDRIVLAHGGGPQIDAALAVRGVPERRVDGLRVTDAQTLATVEAVLCGTVNKAIVRALAERGVAAVGVSGEDAGILLARRLVHGSGAELGFVGEIVSIDTGLLRLLLGAGFLPVIAPLAIDTQRGGALNVNADSCAGAIAGALAADLYVNITNVARVRARSNDDGSEVATLSVEDAQRRIASGDLSGGIRPKVLSAIEALAAGARRAFICGASESPIAAAVAGFGTEIVAGI